MVLSEKKEGVEVRSGIALPDTERHRFLMENIAPVLVQLGIAVFWVREGGEVEIVSSWEL